MVARIWHGLTTLENAGAYEKFLETEFMPAVENKNIPGYKRFQLLKREEPAGVSFITIMWFDTLEQVKAFAGEDYERSVIYPDAIPLLTRYDQRSQHYEVKN